MDPLSELLPPLSRSEARAEAQRCLHCYDAPCLQACPTHIDVPGFIRKIATGNLTGSARVILEANFLGGTCARVCPVEELCEGACVLREQPIQIGRLQRHAVDHVQERGEAVLFAGAPTGRRVAVVGSGPAGLSAAAELARQGHAVTVFERRELGGGLSTYGITGLREPVEVSLREVEAARALGVAFVYGFALSTRAELDSLLAAHDAVVLAVGLGAEPPLGLDGEEDVPGGLALIEASKLRPETLPVGGRVVVVGAGNTALDAAVVARRAGAAVTVVYRRSPAEMPAYPHEYALARREGVEFRFLAQPLRLRREGGRVTGLECVEMVLGEPDASGRPAPTPRPGSEFVLPCDRVIRATGQTKTGLAAALGLETVGGYLRVDRSMQTSLERVYAAGDCVRVTGEASTVMAVQDGKRVAAHLGAALLGQEGLAGPVQLRPPVPPEVREHPLYREAHAPTQAHTQARTQAPGGERHG